VGLRSILIPTYNGAPFLRKLCAEIQRVLPGTEIIVIDDNSPDGTGQIADDIAREDGNMRVIHRPSRLGVGSAIYDGFRAASGEHVATIDVDLHHPPELLPKLFYELEQGADIAVASRYAYGGTFKATSKRRYLINWVGNKVANIITGMKVRDITGGYRAYKKAVFLECYDPRDRGGEFNITVLMNAHKKGYAIKEVPYFSRHIGGSNLNVALRYLKVLLRNRLGM
jgi:dolichol-phosphate mannosyltransferase